jgi:hypothetical protein
VLVSLPLECLGEALLSQVLVPQLGEALVFGVELRVVAGMSVANEVAPLLDARVIVAPVLCEAPDYVKWSGRMQSGRGRSSFRLHIIRAMRGT